MAKVSHNFSEEFKDYDIRKIATDIQDSLPTYVESFIEDTDNTGEQDCFLVALVLEAAKKNNITFSDSTRVKKLDKTKLRDKLIGLTRRLCKKHVDDKSERFISDLADSLYEDLIR